MSSSNRIAGFWRRCLAFILDFIILFAFSSITSLINEQFFFDNQWLGVLIVFPLYIFYRPVLEYFFQATIGKMILKQKVVTNEGYSLKITTVLIRNCSYMFLYFAQFMFYMIQLNIDVVGYDLYATITDLYLMIQGLTGIFLIIDFIFLLVDINKKRRTLLDRLSKTIVVDNRFVPREKVGFSEIDMIGIE